MDEIKNTFDELVQKFWRLKESNNQVKILDLIMFYQNYLNHENLLLDSINRQIIYNDNISFIERSQIAKKLKEIGNNQYNRLIVDSLLELECDEANNILKSILNSSEDKELFKQDFCHHPRFGEIIEHTR